MIKLLVLAIWIALIAILFLAINLFALSRIFAKPKKRAAPKKTIAPDIPIDEMHKIVENKESDETALKSVFAAIAAHHPIEPKKDGKTSKNAKALLDLIFTMAGHKNMSKELRGEMYGELGRTNPSYERDFQKAAGG